MPRSTDSQPEQDRDSFLFRLANASDSEAQFKALLDNEWWGGFWSGLACGMVCLFISIVIRFIF